MTTIKTMFLGLTAVAACASSVSPAGAADVGGGSVARSAVVKVSLYGVQRYDETSVSVEGPESQCADERGTTESHSVVRFATRRSVRMRLTAYTTGATTLVPVRAGDDLDLRTTVEHRGAQRLERASCADLESGRKAFRPVPEPASSCPGKTVDWLAMDLDTVVTAGRITARGGPGALTPLVNPWAGCLYGDHSNTLYEARGRIPVRELLGGAKAQAILRGADVQRSGDPAGDRAETSRRTTVYLTLAPLRRGR